MFCLLSEVTFLTDMLYSYQRIHLKLGPLILGLQIKALGSQSFAKNSSEAVGTKLTALP